MSQENQTDTGVSTAVAETAEPIIKTKAAKKIKKVPPKGTPERTEWERVTKQAQRVRTARKNAVESLKYTSKIEVTKTDALELLAQRISNPHVREVAYEIGLACAEATGVFPNKFFWAHGYQKLVASQKAKAEQFLEMDSKEVIPSEIVFASDLYCIWDYSVSCREPDVTYEDFIAKRAELKSSWFELGLFMNVPLEEKPHKGWAAFLPAFKPTLQPNYSLGDMRNWLMEQKSVSHPDQRDFLLMAPRGSMKTASGVILLAQALLCAPSLRLLLCSETRDGSGKFVKQFRSIWEQDGDPAYARFQYWFPEFCQSGGSVKTFTCPMRHLAVREETAEAISMDVAAQP